jgi:hypothetical protein
MFKNVFFRAQKKPKGDERMKSCEVKVKVKVEDKCKLPH